MKKVITLLAAILIFLPPVFTQQYEAKRPSQIGVSFYFTDYKTPDLIRSNSLSTVFREKNWAKPRDMDPGIGIHYFKGLADKIDFAGRLGISFQEAAIPNKTFSSSAFFELDAAANFKMLSDHYWLQPYLSAGVGAQQYKGYYGAFIPLGAGFNVDLFGEADVFIATTYKIPVITETSRYRFNYSFGVAGNITSRKTKQPDIAPPPPPVDTDGDGITDDKDKCPTVPGVVKYDGCPVPDTDKDGINDEKDKCPTVPGLAKYDGCPVPDTDKDGISDEEDKCPTVPGVARYEGCPVPDTDGDGINDEEDKCPDVKGVASQQGCPEISQEVIRKVEYAAKNIYFNTGSSKLLSRSFKPLNEVVDILKQNTDLSLSIDGHTDNTGPSAFNQSLSQKRAEAVKAYMISKGISAGRLTAAGYGQDQPVADNNTAAGRQQNRRVELKLNY